MPSDPLAASNETRRITIQSITGSRACVFAVAFALLSVVPAKAQLGPLPGLPALSLGQPNGPARLDGNGVLSASLPSTVSSAQVAATGVVQSISIGSGGGYVLTPPSITIAAPPAGGSQAVATVSSMGIGSTLIVSAGAGYTVGALLSLNGGMCSAAPVMQVTNVNGSGGVTGTAAISPGLCTAIPNPYTMTATTNSGSGSGASFNVNWSVTGVRVISGGSGYTFIPSVTFSPTTSPLPSSGTATGNASLANLLALGISGIGGSGIAAQGAFVDASKIRIAATGSPLTIPPNTSWLALIQPGTLSSQTLTLPTSPADGLILRISTAGAISALTLSPPVPGWTNASSLPANSGFELGWDAGLAVWLPFTGGFGTGAVASGPALNTVSNTYTNSGAISTTDSFALINSARAVTMTLAAGNMNGHSIVINNYGTGTTTISLMLGGSLSTVTLAQGSVLNVTWSASLATYLLNA